MKDKSKITESLGNLADKVDVGSSEVFKGKSVVTGEDVTFTKPDYNLNSGRVDKIPTVATIEQDERRMAIWEAGTALVEFAKQRNTTPDAVIVWLLDHFEKQSILGKKKNNPQKTEPQPATEIPTIDKNAGLSFAERMRRKKCGLD